MFRFSTISLSWTLLIFYFLLTIAVCILFHTIFDIADMSWFAYNVRHLHHVNCELHKCRPHNINGNRTNFNQAKILSLIVNYSKIIALKIKIKRNVPLLTSIYCLISSAPSVHFIMSLSLTNPSTCSPYKFWV